MERPSDDAALLIKRLSDRDETRPVARLSPFVAADLRDRVAVDVRVAMVGKATRTTHPYHASHAVSVDHEIGALSHPSG